MAKVKREHYNVCSFAGAFFDAFSCITKSARNLIEMDFHCCLFGWCWQRGVFPRKRRFSAFFERKHFYAYRTPWCATRFHGMHHSDILAISITTQVKWLNYWDGAVIWRINPGLLRNNSNKLLCINLMEGRCFVAQPNTLHTF